MATRIWVRARRQLGIIPAAKEKDDDPNAIPDLDAALQRRKRFRSRPGLVERVSPYIPAIEWLADYDFKLLLRADILAGLTTAALLVPQGLAYAELAGVQPIRGLYSAMMTGFMYVLLGTCRHMSAGPGAIVAILTADTLSAASDEQTFSFSVLLAFLVGVIQVSMGVLRMGFVVNFLSSPVVSGFMSSAAVLIGTSQLKTLFGVSFQSHTFLPITLYRFFAVIEDTKWQAITLGVASIIVLVLLKKFFPKVPKGLVMLIGSTLIAWWVNDESKLPMVGSIAAGLPTTSHPFEEIASAGTLISRAVAISLVSFLELISIGQKFSHKHGYEISSNQEFIALGSANIANSFFSGIPCTGGLSRSAVNEGAGAKTRMAAIVSSLIVLLSMVALTPLFFYVPRAGLAALICNAVTGLFNGREPPRLWQTSKSDFLAWMTTFLATLSFGSQNGIICGFLLANLQVVWHSSKPYYAVLGRLTDESICSYKDICYNPSATVFTGIVMLRFDAELFFANITTFKDMFEHARTHYSLPGRPIHAFVLDSNAINRVDSVAIKELSALIHEWRAAKVEIFFAGLKASIKCELRKSGLLDHEEAAVRKENSFVDIKTAVAAASDYASTMSDGELPQKMSAHELDELIWASLNSEKNVNSPRASAENV